MSYFLISSPFDDTYRIFYKFVFETLVDVDDQSDQDLQNGGYEKVLVDLRSIVPEYPVNIRTDWWKEK